MVSISATNSATPSLQSALGRNRLAQARQQADQAEAHARNLRAQANQAERQAAQSQNVVRELSARQGQADPTYPAQAPTERPPASQEARDKQGNRASQDFLLSLYKASTQQLEIENSPLKTDPFAQPITNTPDDIKGRIVNVRA